MLKLSSGLVRAKNKLVDTGAWIILIEIRDKNNNALTDEIKICSNNEEIEWPTGSGKIWTPYPFEIGSSDENSKNETSTTSLSICNIDGILNSYVDEKRGFLSHIVIVRFVHSNNLSLALVPTYQFRIKSTSVTSENIVFTIGSDSIMSKSDPKFKMNRSFCRYSMRLDDPLCGYTIEHPGHTNKCDGTLTRCRELGWQLKFGGFPGMNATDVFYG